MHRGKCFLPSANPSGKTPLKPPETGFLPNTIISNEHAKNNNDSSLSLYFLASSWMD